MRTIRPLAAAVFTFCLAFATNSALARSIEEQKWIRMESENFSVYSTVNKIDTRDLLKHLEAVRSLLPAVTSGDMVSQIPTQIFVVSTGSQYEQLGFDRDRTVAVFVAALLKNFIVMVDTHAMDGTSTIVHEYVHYLLRNAVRLPFPKWFEEGYADYIASSLLTKKDFSYGRASVGHAYTLAAGNWLDMEKVLDSRYLLENDEANSSTKYYAQSWLLVHYLISENGGIGAIMQNLAKHMEARRQGADEIGAFEAGFDVQIEDLERQLKKYAKKGKYYFSRVPVAREIYELDPEVTVLETTEIAIELGELLLALGRTEPDPENSKLASAKDLFSIALSSDATRARAEIGLARLALKEGDTQTAEEYAKLGADKAPDNLSAQIDAANLWIQQADRSRSASPELLKHAELYLRNALAIDASNAEVIFSVGRFLLLSGEIEKGLQHIETAAYKAPSVLHVQWTLASELARYGLNDKALHYARELLYTRHVSDSNRQMLRSFISELEDLVAQ